MDRRAARRTCVGSYAGCVTSMVYTSRLRGKLPELRSVDDFRYGGFQRFAAALLRFERSALGAVHIRSVERNNRLRTGKENAVVLAGLQTSFKGRSRSRDRPGGDREFEILDFLRLESIGGDADLVDPGREQR